MIALRYFVTAEERKVQGGTLYFEFQRGRFCGKFWKDDSIYMYADIFDSNKLIEAMIEVIPEFAYWGLTEVNCEKWETLLSVCHARGGVYQAVIGEMTPWADACFETADCFTVCGI